MTSELPLAPLRVLVVEDSDDDARLVMRALERSGLAVSFERVDTADALVIELSTKHWDVILADYTLPSFSGIEALHLSQRLRPDVPFIIVSGTITEDTAVQVMKAGAQDYVLKNNLARLAPAVRRELAEASLRAEHVRRGRELAGLRARAEEEVERQRHQLEIVLRGLAEGVFAEDEQGRFVYVNDAAAAAFGDLPSDALLGAEVSSILARFDITDERGALLAAKDMPARQALEGHTTVERVVRLSDRTDGEEHWYIVTSAWMHGTSASAPMVITIARDITDRKREEIATQFLASASERLAGSLDLGATLETTVHAVLPLLGDWAAIELGDEALREHPARVAHVEAGRDARTRALWSELAKGASARVLATGEAELLQADVGADRWAIMVVGLATYERPFGTLTFGRRGLGYREDERALAHEAARRAAFALENARIYAESQDAIRTRDEFLAVASHELRTPLTALTLQLLVAQRYSASAELPKRLDAAVRHTKRLATLVDNLLDASRVTTGTMRLLLEEVDLVSTVRDVVDRFHEEARRARCEVLVHAPSPVVGAWDRLRVEQVVTNLLSNALKYGAGARVDVTVETAGPSAVISVRDRGIGIAPEDVARIFGKFERAVSARHYGGLGLGLFIARQIVEAHGGAIRVDSAPGNGSTFTVELPMRAFVERPQRIVARAQ